jgi:type II secretory pathway pseudopilin PulG
MALAKSRFSNSEAGFTLAEVLVATGILVTGLVAVAQLFAIGTQANIAARSTTYATVLAEQKIEQLRALAWGFDTLGLPVSDISTDISVTPETPNGGTGLAPSPASALQENTPGYVDYVDAWGNIVAPGDAIYVRRWSIEPLPMNPNNTLIIQVLVARNRDRGAADDGNVGRLPEEARIVTVKTRKSQ